MDPHAQSRAWTGEDQRRWRCTTKGAMEVRDEGSGGRREGGLSESDVCVVAGERRNGLKRSTKRETRFLEADRLKDRLRGRALNSLVKKHACKTILSIYVSYMQNLPQEWA